MTRSTCFKGTEGLSLKPCFVTKTLRQVESSQKVIRVVGLSATLPNYINVATFMRFNP